MYEDTVVSFSHPDQISIEDPLTQVLRSGARRLLAEAVEAEVETFVADHADLLDEAGRRRVVRHGYLPERDVQTGIGAVAENRASICFFLQNLVVWVGFELTTFRLAPRRFDESHQTLGRI